MKRFFIYASAAAVAVLLTLQLRQARGSAESASVAAIDPGQTAGLSSSNSTTTTAAAAAAEAAQVLGTPAAGAHAGHPHAALRANEPLPSSRRAWDSAFIDSFQHKSAGAAVRFELTDGVWADGTIASVQRQNGEVIFVRGELTSPEQGTFFFQKQTEPGLQGAFAGLVTLPASRTAYRIEPTGPDGASELVRRRLDEVLCILPPPAQAIAEEIPPLDPSDHPDYPIPAYQEGIIPLQSLPGAVGVLYIDYRGGYNDNGWGSFAYEKPNVSNAQIKDVWKRVAEDFIPFNINVTTDIKVYEAAPQNSRVRCAVTPTTTAAPGAGGVAYMNAWNWTGDTPCWAFGTSGKYAAEIISHEVGHTLSLGHDGNSKEGYYGGQGGGSTGWAPIMGVGYYQPVAQWSKGEYTDANNKEDDLAKIDSNNNNVDYKVDDTGANLATARYLEVWSNNTAFAEGVIERSADTDAFRFTTTGGYVSLRADPAPGEWANLAISATLANQSETILYSNNVQSQLWGSISATLPAGTYTFRVTGAGRNNPLTDGFSSYASLGYYTVTGTVAGALQPSRFTVPENSPYGTVVGTVTHPYLGIHTLGYSIVSGNVSNAFAISSAGVLTVLNAAALNYEALAQKTQQQVQYEMFVNITDFSNNALSELNRRVVVAVTDVNEPATVVGFTNTMLTGTAPGTAIGTVTANDPDYYTISRFSIVGGNSSNFFAIGESDGVLRVNSTMGSTAIGTHNLTIQVDDTGTNSLSSTGNVRLTIVGNQTPFEAGSINYAVYDGIGSSVFVNDMVTHPRFPLDPTWERKATSFEGDTDRADNYGTAMRGYLIPPVSGSYTFYVSSDDNSELRVSTSTNPASATIVASISGSSSWTSSRDWGKYASQRSSPIFLTAGQGYYVEVRQKEGGGGDNVAVGWSGPATAYKTNVIPGIYLAPYPLNYVPQATGFTTNVRRDTLRGARVGRVVVTDANVADKHSFAILGGNWENIFEVDSKGHVVVADAAALAATMSSGFTLNIRATDNGSPPQSTTCSVTLNIVDSTSIAADAIRRELFYNVGASTSLSDLTGNAKYPGRPDALKAMKGNNFESDKDVADSYGSRVRALVVAPESGDYRFFVAADDTAQLKFSYTTNAASATVIASLSNYTDANQWNKYSSQSGTAYGLVAGQSYYIEVLQKENSGGDHVSVGWVVPGSGVTNVIPEAYLRPVDLNYAPSMPAQTFTVFPAIVNGAPFATVTANDSAADTLTYEIVSGNTGGTFAIDAPTGRLSVTNNTLIASGSVTSFVLSIKVQDSGCGGLYPLRSGSGTVTVNVGSANMPYVWMGAGELNRWSDYANWAGVRPVTGARVIFGQSSLKSNVNDVATSLASVLFTNSGFYCTGNPVGLQYGLTNTGANTWAIPTTLLSPQTWTHTGGGEFQIAGPLTNNGFTQTLLANGDMRISGSLSGTGSFSKTGTGRLLMGGTHHHTGLTIVAASGGTTTALEIYGSPLVMGGSSLTMNGRMDMWNQNATVGALFGSGTIFANNGNRILTIGANNLSATFTGIIQDRTWASGVTLGLVKTGTGSQTFSAIHSFSGGLTVDQGVLTLAAATSTGNDAGHGSALNPITLNPNAQLIYSATRGAGFHTGPVTLHSNATVRFNGTDNNFASGNAVTLNSATISGNGQLRVRGGNGLSPRYFVNPGITGSTINVNRLTLTGDNGMTNAVFDVADGPADTDLLIASAVDGQLANAAEGIVKAGAGTMRLTGACTYAGPTVVSGGVLLVDGTLARGAAVTIKANTLLGGNGAISNMVVVETGGTLSPGSNGIGRFTMDAGASLNGVTLMELDTANGTNDCIASSGTITYGGTLTVTIPDGMALRAGASFKLFEAAAYNGAFAATNLPALSDGLLWQWSPATGTLMVKSAINAEPPAISSQLVGNTLQLTWPEDRTGWTLQQLTLDGAGYDATNWVDVDLSTLSNSHSVPIEPGVPGKLFRMKYQP